MSDYNARETNYLSLEACNYRTPASLLRHQPSGQPLLLKSSAQSRSVPVWSCRSAWRDCALLQGVSQTPNTRCCDPSYYVCEGRVEQRQAQPVTRTLLRKLSTV